MKQPKKLTRNQKEFVKSKRRDPNNYMFISQNDTHMYLWNKKKEVITSLKL